MPYKLLTASKIFLLSLFLMFSVSCNEKKNNDNSEPLAEHHRWSAAQTSVIKQLWIGFAKAKSEPTNNQSSNIDAAELGHHLFFDKQLSRNNEISCASCHKPELYFSDNLVTAKGIETTRRNTPSIVGANHSDWYFHDGRADSLWSQALGPLENAQEHGGNRSLYAHYIYNSPMLRAQYERVFGLMPNISDTRIFPINAGPVKDDKAFKNWQSMTVNNKKTITQIFVNIGKSIAAYEVKLQPSASRVDQYIKAVMVSDKENILKQLNKSEATGLRIFTSKANCILCHNGPMLTDFSFHNVATVDINNKPYDLGRYEGAKQVLKVEFNCHSEYNDNKNDSCDELKYISLDQHETIAAFKTPGLRNVSKTAPYMHDGQFKRLAEVIDHYNKPDKLILGQKDLLVISLTDQDKEDLVAFLKALDSSIDADSRWLSAPN